MIGDNTVNLTRQRNGLYMITSKPPKIGDVDGIGTSDVYVDVGDSLGIRNLCQAGVESRIGKRLMHLQTIKCRLDLTVVEDQTVEKSQ
jgi:hypothetical protein